MWDPRQLLKQASEKLTRTPSPHTSPYCAIANNRYDTRKDMKFAPDAPVIGLVLQRSHLVTGDEGHYSGVVSELEARGAKVVCVFAGECAGGLGDRWL